MYLLHSGDCRSATALSINSCKSFTTLRQGKLDMVQLGKVLAGISATTESAFLTAAMEGNCRYVAIRTCEHCGPKQGDYADFAAPDLGLCRVSCCAVIFAIDRPPTHGVGVEDVGEGEIERVEVEKVNTTLLRQVRSSKELSKDGTDSLHQGVAVGLSANWSSMHESIAPNAATQAALTCCPCCDTGRC